MLSSGSETWMEPVPSPGGQDGWGSREGLHMGPHCEQSFRGVLPSAPALRAQPPGTPTAENSAGQRDPIVSLRSLCSWAVCFQCPGTDFPTCQLSSSSSSCLCTALGLWEEGGLAGSEGSGGSPSVMWQLNTVKPLEPVPRLSLGHREGRDSRREAALAVAGVFSHLPPYTTTTACHMGPSAVIWLLSQFPVLSQQCLTLLFPSTSLPWGPEPHPRQ